VAEEAVVVRVGDGDLFLGLPVAHHEPVRDDAGARLQLALQDAAQAHSHPGVQFRAHASCPSLEVAAPAPYHPIYIDDDLLQGSPVTALGSLSDSFFELLLTLLTRPFVPALKMPAEELEAFSGARIHDPRFLRVQPQSGFFHPASHLGQGLLGLGLAAT